jgi:hypothetical protein
MQVNTVCGPVPSTTEQRMLWHCAGIKHGIWLHVMPDNFIEVTNLTVIYVMNYAHTNYSYS